MLFEICKELNNFFEYEKVFDTFSISNGDLTGVSLERGQYFRIIGSLFNDGVYKHPVTLQDETFDGAVWKMAVPPDFEALCSDISEWVTKYGSSSALSPFTSESFGGYSYTKGGGSGAGGSATWQDAFASRLNIWRKPRCRY